MLVQLATSLMLIPIEKLPMSKVTGVIHIGAHEAEELDIYLLCGIRRVAWIEANPFKIDVLRKKIGGLSEMRLGHFAAGETNGKKMLNLANNGQSSSILSFGTHVLEHPEIAFTGKVEVNMIRIDDWLSAEKLNRSEYNFMNLDIQGYELNALRGAVRQLSHVDFIYTEVNERELYSGCALIGDMDGFLRGFGFVRVATAMTSHGWGDAFYFRALT